MAVRSRLSPTGAVRGRSWSRRLLLAGCGALLFAAVATAQQSEEEPTEALFNPRDFPKGWTFYCADATRDFRACWQWNKDQSASDGVLICLGKPDGYIRTERSYDNYELGFEWKFPTDPNGNSGILLHTSDKDQIWPKSIQVQLHRPTAGSVFHSSGAKTDNTLQAKDLSRPLAEWNSCVVTSDRGKISVVLNGQKVGEVTGCVPSKGSIAIQSEGAEVHFRKVWIRPLKAAAVAEK